ncbi:limonene-1,2-epoxide hydrolase family protein [Williamsia deligens]|uniref:Limonene-1,2-epoxide hydrolase family protein n=1 Tax=Williamsia deligens TaxID=321325 RepID=A0ABW3G788_9NOCA|nr:limonene-1,2-epoxide hydrolase family protein [Williamsia deligens]MCP2193184.1 limonene-1,2-epoxide hydrolase [Williamsia deligens]
MSQVEVVDDFLHALARADLGRASELLDDDLLYQNVGLPSIRSARSTIALFRRFTRVGRFDVVVHRATGDEDGAVLNERTDLLAFGPFVMTFWVCGVFEVRDGRITLWRDYFDAVAMLAAAARGVLGVVVPPLRPALPDGRATSTGSVSPRRR